MKLTPKELTVKTDKADLIYLHNYMVHCEAIDIIDGYTNPFFHSLFTYSFQSLLEKLCKLIFNSLHQKADHKLKFKINQAERTIMSMLFKIEQVPAELQHIEFQIINQLHLQ